MLRKKQNKSTQMKYTALKALGLTTVLMAAVSYAEAQTYQVIHNFTGGADGALPESTLTMDQGGHLYGTAGNSIYRMTKAGSSWILNPLYVLPGGMYGSDALGPVVFGPDGSLYGTTIAGGYSGGDYCNGGCGVVFRLRPPATAPSSVIAPWSETVLHAFLGPPTDGDQPVYGTLSFDAAGNIYGTTNFGGSGGFGTVFKVSPYQGGWTESVVHGFDDGAGGSQPYGGVVRDPAGNLYGTTGYTNTVYELSPTANGWVETVLHSFSGRDDGWRVYAGLVRDQAGNLFGATASGGTNNGGVIYELSPSGEGWNYKILYNLSGSDGPYENLTLDSAGNIYGATFGDGTDGAGMIFKLSQSNGVWTLTDLHDFTFDTAWFPYGGVTLDADGNIFGTASSGGAYGWGVAWEITP